MQNIRVKRLVLLVTYFIILLLSGCGTATATSGESREAVAGEEGQSTVAATEKSTQEQKDTRQGQLPDGEYSAKVTLQGGSGRASMESPAEIIVKNGKMYATIRWDSANYDYMVVDGQKYLNESAEGNATFTIPIPGFQQEIPVIGNTTAMGTPHEVAYTICFSNESPKDSLEDEKDTPVQGSRELQKQDEGYENASGVDFHSLSCTGEEKLQYANQFKIEQYGSYRLITIHEGERFLLVPEGGAVPENLPEDVGVLQQPLDSTYLVSTSAMDLIQTIQAISFIRLSGTREDSWYIEEAAEEMKKGNMLYAGKYNMPDYELILREGCNLAIENTMIYHNPQVKEKLEGLGIPVLVERSSYEEHPLGRLEWIKLYGVLFGKEAQADAYYKEQLSKIEAIMKQKKTNCKIAFFSVTSNGAVTVRKPNDYIAQMIHIAGGSYAWKDVLEQEDNALSTVKMQMESFYASSKDADILIYNSTIEGELEDIQDLIGKNPLFAEFKAVKEGRVYCTNRDFFQKSTAVGAFIQDLNHMITDSDLDNLTCVKKLR